MHPGNGNLVEHRERRTKSTELAGLDSNCGGSLVGGQCGDVAHEADRLVSHDCHIGLCDESGCALAVIE